MKIPFRKTLRFRILSGMIVLALLAGLLLSAYFSIAAKQKNVEMAIRLAQTNLESLIDRIQARLTEVRVLTDSFTVNSQMQKVLTIKDRTTPDSKRAMLDLQKSINAQIKFSSIGSYLTSFVLHGDNGITLQCGDGAMLNEESLFGSDWFSALLNEPFAVRWQQIAPTPLRFSNYSGQVYPILLRMVNIINGKPMGWCLLCFKETMISDLYREEDAKLKNTTIILSNEGVCISAADGQLLGNDMKSIPYVQAAMNAGNAGNVYTKDNRVAVYSQVPLSAWHIVRSFSLDELTASTLAHLASAFLVLFIVAALITVPLALLLSKRIDDPVKRLLMRMDEIATGNYLRALDVETTDEIGKLGKGVNDLAVHIQSLLEKVKTEENEKRELEIATLHNQINPHFLFNTLNSLRWMAQIQQSYAIRDTIDALSRLLRKALNHEALIPLGDELSLVYDYVKIQNVRYGGTISILADVPEDLKPFSIPCFALQPIIENTIFHGFEPHDGLGEIHIKASREHENLIIVIEDDGFGISGEKVNELQASINKRRSGGPARSIGLWNVQQRIRLTFGEAYGLHIKSREGFGTCVTLRMPLICIRKEDQDASHTAGG